MDPVNGFRSMSMAALYAMYGMAMPGGAAAPGALGGTGEAGPSTGALAMESASLASGEALVAALMNGLPNPAVSSAGGAASLARALASLSTLDPAAELQRISS
jgi:hypothetical protein